MELPLCEESESEYKNLQTGIQIGHKIQSNVSLSHRPPWPKFHKNLQTTFRVIRSQKTNRDKLMTSFVERVAKILALFCYRASSTCLKWKCTFQIARMSYEFVKLVHFVTYLWLRWNWNNADNTDFPGTIQQIWLTCGEHGKWDVYRKKDRQVTWSQGYSAKALTRCCWISSGLQCPLCSKLSTIEWVRFNVPLDT